ncbi:hypothetical protein DOY81_002965 [Sarcophaga bullata]|nr:hypothetical protein DOY81_002965 [Sarcophaga bullata]
MLTNDLLLLYWPHHNISQKVLMRCNTSHATATAAATVTATTTINSPVAISSLLCK